MSTTWFTADLHLGAFDAVSYNGRPFADIDVMAEELIHNWSECVGEDDEVFILGDFADHDSEFRAAHRRLRGHKHFIIGNHDPKWMRDPEHAMGELPGSVVYANEGVRIKREGVMLVLSHYPFAAWTSGALHLHGHLHGGKSPLHKHRDHNPDYPHRVDVGVDAWEFKPVSLAQIVERARGQECRCHGKALPRPPRG